MTGEEMRRLRTRKSWTQHEMGTWLGLTRNTIARMERGELQIPETVSRLAQLVMDEKNRQKILKIIAKNRQISLAISDT